MIWFEEQIFSGEVEFLIAPASEGEIGIHPHHIPLITKLNPGLIRIKLPEKAMHLVYVISGGFLEVQGNKAQQFWRMWLSVLIV